MHKLLFVALLILCTHVNAQPKTHPFQDAQWITVGYPEDTVHATPPVFKKTFNTRSKIRSAQLFITCLGLYEATINGSRIGDAYFTPGWTSYDHRLQYQQYDVTKFIRAKNDIEITVAEGWYRGAFGAELEKDHYGREAGVLFELNITYTNGQQERIVSDTSWLSGKGSIISSGFYEGEKIDTRKTAGEWTPVVLLDHSKDMLVPTTVEPVRQQEHFAAKKILITPNGQQVIDFGQNIAGWVRIKVNGNAGDTIKIAHAEVLDKSGNFYTGNLREAKATDVYILKGGQQILEPHFTYHGFRFIKVEGIRGPLDAKNFTAIALYSDMVKAGTFECSDSLVNQLQRNITWSLNSNFVDVPTDCPQRSERFGWTGDAQVFVSTAAYNRNIKLFFQKWLRDLAADQGRDGSVPRIIPDFYDHRDTASKGGVAGWSDAATVIPWTLFEFYGDTSTIRDQYASMKAWVDYIAVHSKDDLWTANGYGDWLAPGAKTEVPFIDQCFFGYSTQLVINAAKVLNMQEDVQHYATLLQKIRTALLNEYFTPAGRCVTNTQTAYVLALHFNLLPDTIRPKAAQRLVQLIRDNNNHLATGFLGTPYLLQVLSDNGYNDLAYTIMKQETFPSWLYPLKKRATTIWEKWDGITPDSNVQATSYNHYAYGAVGDWLFRTIGGIRAAAPGFKKIIIQPHIGAGLTYANTSYQCGYGKIVSNWKIEEGKLRMDITIPPNTTAVIHVPGKTYRGTEVHEVKAGTYRYVVAWTEP